MFANLEAAMARQDEERWKTVAARHRAAVDGFVASAREIAGADWQSPLADGKWTPAQVTQHLIQTYEVLTQQVRTGTGLKVQTGWLLRQVLRLAVLRPIMWTRKLPPGARAPRSLLPVETEEAQDAALQRLLDVVAAFETELAARRGDAGLELTHHIFGSVDAVSGLDFVAVHTEHHSRQLARRS
jgi:hypothetical protein